MQAKQTHKQMQNIFRSSHKSTLAPKIKKKRMATNLDYLSR